LKNLSKPLINPLISAGKPGIQAQAPFSPNPSPGDDESASSSDDPSRPSRRRAGLRPRGKRRRVAESSGGEEDEEEQQQSEENEEQYGGGEEELPSLEPGRGEGQGQWQLATGLEGRRLAPPLGYQGIEGTVGFEERGAGCKSLVERLGERVRFMKVLLAVHFLMSTLACVPNGLGFALLGSLLCAAQTEDVDRVLHVFWSR
jgi:hypothetical protein